MRVHWTARAEARLDAIHAYITPDNPAAAARVIERILRRSGQIAMFPQSGRRVPDFDRDDVREIFEGDYRIIYRVLVDRVDVVAVMHCAQLLPGDLGAI